MPLLGKYRRPVTWPTTWIWPTMVCLPTSVLALVIGIPQRISRWTTDKPEYIREMRSGETKEYLLAVFLMLYLASLYWRLRKGQIGKSGNRTAGS